MNTIDLTNPEKIKKILKKYNLAPNKFMGQNFLVDKSILEKIVGAAQVAKWDNILEIGPGLGTLTNALLEKCANVIAIEKDKDLILVLEDNLKGYKNVAIINDDFLKLDFERLVSAFREKGKTDYKIVSNLPYYITSPVIRKILSSNSLPREIVFLIQREVAKRICAKPGQMSFISAFVQFYGRPEITEIVKPQSFWPKPKVDSAILKIIPRKETGISGNEEGKLWRLVKIGFSSRRKTLANNLSAGLHLPKGKIVKMLEKSGFSEKIRAQELDAGDWIKLLRKLVEQKQSA